MLDVSYQWLSEWTSAHVVISFSFHGRACLSATVGPLRHPQVTVLRRVASATAAVPVVTTVTVVATTAIGDDLVGADVLALVPAVVAKAALLLIDRTTAIGVVRVGAVVLALVPAVKAALLLPSIFYTICVQLLFFEDFLQLTIVFFVPNSQKRRYYPFPTCPFMPGDIVLVAARTGPRMNKAGGVGKVAKVDEEAATATVVYLIGRKRTEKNIPFEDMVQYNLGPRGSRRKKN